MEKNYLFKVIEKTEKSALLTSHFDSNRSFYYPSFDLEFFINEQHKSFHLYEELEYYLTYSDHQFYNYFYFLYEYFTPKSRNNYKSSRR